MKATGYFTPYNSDELRRKYEETGDIAYVLKGLAIGSRAPRWAKNAWAAYGIANGDALVNQGKKGRHKSLTVAYRDWEALTENGTPYQATKATKEKSRDADYQRLHRIKRQYGEPLKRERQWLNQLKDPSIKILNPDSLQKSGEYKLSPRMLEAFELFADLEDVIEDMYNAESITPPGDIRVQIADLPVLFDALIERMNPSYSPDDDRKRLTQMGLPAPKIEQIIKEREAHRKKAKTAMKKLKDERCVEADS